MKKVLFLGCVILMQSLFGYSQDSKTRGFYSELDKSLEKHPYISYTVEQENFIEEGKSFTFLYHISFDRSVKKNPVCYCFSDDTFRCLKFDKDSIVYIDPIYEEIHKYSSDGEMKDVQALAIFIFSYQLNDEYSEDYVFLSSFLDNHPMMYVDWIVNDTVIVGSNCKVYMSKSSETEFQIDVPGFNYYDVVVYYNKDKQWVDSVVTSLPSDVDEFVRQNAHFQKQVYKYKDVSFENKTVEYDSIFSERNPVYAIYEHFDDSNPYGDTYSSKPGTEKVLDILTDDILEHPFVNVNGDTITLGQQEGWVLIEAWYDGCWPCKRWMVDYENEKKEKGMTSLEQAGIKVLCVNPYVSYIDHLRKTADKYGIGRIVYAGKGFMEKIFWNHPLYYLVSPDKHIVFTSETYVEDNSIFIEKMKEYEAR